MKNKNALIRYIAIDRCLMMGRCTIAELLVAVNNAMQDIKGSNASLRTLHEDIKDRRDRMLFDAPIVKVREEGNTVYYKYRVPNYSIFTKNYKSNRT